MIGSNTKQLGRFPAVFNLRRATGRPHHNEMRLAARLNSLSSDITHLPMARGFLYPVAIMDWQAAA